MLIRSESSYGLPRLTNTKYIDTLEVLHEGSYRLYAYLNDASESQIPLFSTEDIKEMFLAYAALTYLMYNEENREDVDVPLLYENPNICEAVELFLREVFINLTEAIDSTFGVADYFKNTLSGMTSSTDMPSIANASNMVNILMTKLLGKPELNVSTYTQWACYFRSMHSRLMEMYSENLRKQFIKEG